MKDRDHGKIQIQCSTMKEAGMRSNRKTFYMDDIEKSVLAGLQKHLIELHGRLAKILGMTDLIPQYAHCCVGGNGGGERGS